jgi:hypothetical protein
VPDRPATCAVLAELEAEEKKLDIGALVERTMDGLREL